jgi:hypothetical protein
MASSHTPPPPGFKSSYDLLLKTDSSDGEVYSFADRMPDVVEQLSRLLDEKRTDFDKLRTRTKQSTYPE